MLGLFELIRKRVEAVLGSDGNTPAEAVEYLIKSDVEIKKLTDAANFLGINADEDSVIKELDLYKVELQRVQQVNKGDFTNNINGNGYVLSEKEEGCFGTYFKNIHEKIKSSDDRQRILDECNLIVQQFLPQPSMNPDRRGMVIGQVQSGKTTIFNGLISAAADIGFNIILILSGTIESLRRQTQKRIYTDVTNPWSEKNSTPFYFTWISNHEGPGFAVNGKANVVLTDLNNPARRQVAIGIFLKNGNVLTKLRKWLNTIQITDQDCIRVLVIDDEADQATPNAGVKKETVTRINEGIKKLVIQNHKEPCPTQLRTSYLGFTATPFANLLNEAGNHTLYPRDFIYFLKSSSKYFGPWQLFGNPDEVEGQETIIPVDVIRLLSDTDINLTVPSSNNIYAPKIGGSLKDSIVWFLLAAAARRVSDPASWATMLIHTSSRTVHHEQMMLRVSEFIKALSNQYNKRIEEFKVLWESEIKKLTSEDFSLAFPDYGIDPVSYPSWEDVLQCLPGVIHDAKVKIDNSLYTGNDRLQYSDEMPPELRIQIGIGGNTLSRGLTLEGLVSSFFARKFTGQSSYDTLLQMGRWFGFRIGYELLPRLWTTEFLRDSFRDLVTMEQNLRHQMNIYLGGQSPAEKAPVISKMPAMAITRKSVIGNIHVAEADFSGTAPQTILFNNSEEWLQNNIEAASRLVSLIMNYRRKKSTNKNNSIGKVFFDGVPLENILEFLEKYNILPDSNKFNKDFIIKFLMTNRDYYKEWSVVIMGVKEEQGREFDFNQDLRIFMNNRSRIADNADVNGFKINLKSLRSTNELLADRPDLVSENIKDVADFWKARKTNKLNPALLIYPIDKNSVLSDRNKNKNRRPLMNYAKNHVIGISIITLPPENERHIKGVSLNLDGAYIDEYDSENNPDEAEV